MPAFDSLPAEDVWDMIHYVQSLQVAAHEVELTEAGLPIEDRQTARERIWASLSRQRDENMPVMAGAPSASTTPGVSRK